MINDTMWTDERARVEDDVGLLLLYPKLEMLQSNDHRKSKHNSQYRYPDPRARRSGTRGGSKCS